MSLQQHVNNVKKFMELAGQSVPTEKSYPSIKERELRARLVLEEALEMIEALGISISTKAHSDGWVTSTNDLEFHCTGPLNQTEVMDAAVDLMWVGVTGPAVMLGLSDKLEACIEEVDQSNLSKFVDGHRDESTGKWVKGPSYKPADISSIIGN